MSTNNPILIYLDTNVYSRPFDDQTQANIQEEANAFLKIIAEVKANRLSLLCSDILDFEVQHILSEEKRAKIEEFLDLCAEHSESSDEVLNVGKRVENNCPVRARDALHIASAILGQARYFLSCDKKVTQKKQGQCYRRVVRTYHQEYFSVMNPILFVEKIEQGELK